MELAPFAIAGRAIGLGSPTYIIAEVSANHGQDEDAAVRLVRAAADVGADAVKLQTYTPDTITIASDLPYFATKRTRCGRGPRSMTCTRTPTCRGSGSRV